jgi:signal transduction histidine kinase
VSTENRFAVLPRKVASEVITAAITRAGWAVAVVVVVLAVPVLLDVYLSRGLIGALPMPLGCLLAILALLLVCRRGAGTALTILCGAATFVLAVAYGVLVLHDAPDLVDDGVYLLNRPAVALVLLSRTARRPLAGLAWSVVGLTASHASIAIADAIAGVPFTAGVGPLITWMVYASAFMVVGVVSARQEARIPDIPKLEAETRQRALEHQFEQRAAAMIHDTVLADLTVIATTTGALGDRASERFRADVAMLKSPTWLDDPASAARHDGEGVPRNGTLALVSEMQWRGLSVSIVGVHDGVVSLSPESARTVHSALRECLDNVLLHSGQTSAELVVGGDAGELTYMVIDRGRGFDPDAVPPAGTGLPDRVVGPIAAIGGTVRVWSRPGSGASILLAVPVDTVDEAAGREEAR